MRTNNIVEDLVKQSHHLPVFAQKHALLLRTQPDFTTSQQCPAAENLLRGSKPQALQSLQASTEYSTLKTSSPSRKRLSMAPIERSNTSANDVSRVMLLRLSSTQHTSQSSWDDPKTRPAEAHKKAAHNYLLERQQKGFPKLASDIEYSPDLLSMILGPWTRQDM